MANDEVVQLWSRIACPTKLVYGKESWASNPQEDGRLQYFKSAEVMSFEGAGHWVHHDRLDGFLEMLRKFL
jgi:pimeloyl-ACP methyl ester carboxylesterase